MKSLLNKSLFACLIMAATFSFTSCKDDKNDLWTGDDDNADRNYIESPYALNSVKDFADNIRSIENVYTGKGLDGTVNASISDYIKAYNPSLDQQVRAAIANSIAKIEAIKEPFYSTARGGDTQTAMDAVSVLEGLLSGEVHEALTSGNIANKDALLEAAMEPYVNKVVIPTYKGMAEEAYELSELCTAILEKYDAKTLSESDIKAACDVWLASREYWEKSEAFLFGPAAEHNIDPHIDSWPLAKTKLEIMLANADQMAVIEAQGGEYVGSFLGYGLLGYHAVEYMIFQLSADGKTSLTHSTEYKSRAELVYLAAVAEDLRNQAIYLYACWVGQDNIPSEWAAILEDAELGSADMTRGYAYNFVNAGKAGSIFVNAQQAAEEIINGCADIADEVANTKMGTPHGAKD